MPRKVKTKVSDEEFLQMVSEYIPKEEEPAPEIPYEQAQADNAQAMIDKFTAIKESVDPSNTDLIEYCDDVIEGYKQKLNEPTKVYTKDEMIKMIDNLKKSCKDFDLLPVPVAYLKEQAKHDDADAIDTLERMRLMEIQQKTKDPKARLENYKNYLLEKLDRKKLDRKYLTNIYYRN